MGKFTNGLFGNYAGRIGDLVFYRINDKPVVRVIGRINVLPTMAQLRNRQEMAVVTAFVQSILFFIKIGYGPRAIKAKRNAYNMAVSFHKKYAIKGSYPDIEIDFGKVMISTGDLLIAQDPGVLQISKGLLFSWFINPLKPLQTDLDQVMLMAYFPTAKVGIYLYPGVTRHEGRAVLEIPINLQIGFAETYISFINEDRSEVADSVYLGRVAFNNIL